MSVQILQLAKLLSMNNSSVMKEMEACAADTEKYCEEHRQEYEVPDWLEETMAEEDYGCIQWIILTECLVKYNIAALLDWKCELEDFADWLKGLAGKRKYKLTFRTAWFDEDESLEEWCALLNAKWQSSGVCLVQLDMDNDAYIILPVLSEQYKSVIELAEAIGQKVYLAGAENPEGSSDILHDFWQRHPLYITTSIRTPLQISCEGCFADDRMINHMTLCELKAGEQFQIVVRAQKFSPKQMIVIGKHFRMSTMEVRQRLSMGKDVYVKVLLIDAMLAMEAFREYQITYELEPYIPVYPHFFDCPKRILQKGYNDYTYFLFDREREKEWAEDG